MPQAAPKICTHPGCNRLTKRGRCDKHRQQADKEDSRRGGTRTQRGYTNARMRASKAYLAHHPLCVHCECEQRITRATVTDHIIPHKGDMELFWDEDNWQALCKTHHDIKTATEDGGFGRPVLGIGEGA